MLVEKPPSFYPLLITKLRHSHRLGRNSVPAQVSPLTTTRNSTNLTFIPYEKDIAKTMDEEKSIRNSFPTNRLKIGNLAVCLAT